MTARTRRRRVGRGALVSLALLLGASGALRLGDGFGGALASSGATAGQAGPVADPAVTCPAPPEALAQALTAREAAVAARESAAEERLAALALADAAIERRLRDLEAAEQALAATLARAEVAAEDDLARLTAVYETMKPKDAAALFEAMQPDFAAGFLGRMRPEAAGAILAGMSPEAAYAASLLLAGRNAAVPRD